LQTMGQRPFGFSTPDGYPDRANEWSGSLTPRWNFALDVVNDTQAGVTIPMQEWLHFGGNDPIKRLGQAILQRDLTIEETQTISSVIGKNDGFNPNDIRTILAMLLSSPAFQWR
jgi:Protein of unknown function (DUF1800)